MKTTIAIAMALAVCACSRTAPLDYEPPGPIVVPCSECTPGGGGAGGGDAGGAGGNACDPHDVFVGSDGCYAPDPLCCSDLYCVSLEATCHAATDGLLPAPYLCTHEQPPTGGASTDYRHCQIAHVTLACTWGDSTVLCCEEN